MLIICKQASLIIVRKFGITDDKTIHLNKSAQSHTIYKSQDISMSHKDYLRHLHTEKRHRPLRPPSWILTPCVVTAHK
jgi:hypothetical protein